MAGAVGSNPITYVGSFFMPQKLSEEQKRALLQDMNTLKQTMTEKMATFQATLLTEPDYTVIEGLVTSIQEEYTEARKAVFERVSQALYYEAQAVIQTVDDEIDELIATLPAKLKLCRKMHELKFPHEFAASHPDFCTFLFESKLAFWIACFRNSTEAGLHNHGVRKSETGQPQIKLNGEWTSWDEIQRVVRYDKELDKVVSVKDSKQEYIYVSPKGLLPQDRFDYKQIFPVEELSEREYQELLRYSKKFYETNAELDPGVEKDAIFQVVTTFRSRWWGFEIPNNWMTKNLMVNFPRHVTLRVISKDRKVYSFGMEMKKEESDTLQYFMPTAMLKTTIAHISVPDYEDPRPCEKKTTTNVPMTSARAQKILDFISENNQQGVRFNFMKQNCTKLAAETLALAGYRVDTRISFGSFFANFAPDLQDVPYIGKPLAAIIGAIMSVVGPILNAVATYTPEPIKQAICYIPGKIQTVLVNIFLFFLGASRTTKPLPKGVDEERDNRTKLGRFSRVMSSPWDIFRDGICDINFSQAIVNWQKEQRSTKEVAYDGSPKLNLI